MEVGHQLIDELADRGVDLGDLDPDAGRAIAAGLGPPPRDLALDRDKKLAIATWSAGREITTTSDLTTREASALIDYLAGRLADQKKEATA